MILRNSRKNYVPMFLSIQYSVVSIYLLGGKGGSSSKAVFSSIVPPQFSATTIV